ncbi:Rz1 family lipoprotein [Salmonella enterica subsp. enterica serovar Mississippi]|nr:Rz1 family lipoprotein [Salmonella enterica subsp. enterica serovar Mississippi]MCB4742408.1 Rz1 family lipoprotein [Salmonella enterica subsp. enterica serovar Mississippi]
MTLPLAAVACSSTPPVPQCRQVNPPTPPAWIMQPAPDWQTPLNGIISPSKSE